MKHRQASYILVAALLALPAGAQVRTPGGGKVASAQPATSPVTPAAPATVSPIVAEIQSAAGTTTADISLLTIRRWKVSGDVKNDAEAKAEAIQRNLTIAMPALLSQVQASPNDFSANFKLYRTLGVLYDVMSSLAESAGAFGSKSDFEALASDLNRIDQARHSLGERLEALASAKDAEIARLQDQVKAARGAVPATPKKIIVDEDASAPKKPAKKTTRKKPSAPAITQSSTTQPGNPQ